jgi:glycosyltransferase involved in cell wall biosynthesis
MRVALIHDWLTGMRGGEKVLEALCEQFPSAELFTLVDVPGAVSPTIEALPRHTSFLQVLPHIRRYYRQALPALPTAIELFNLDGFDLVVSSSHCAAKSVVVPGRARHVCYCHTPMRYAWDQFPNYFGPERLGRIGSRAAAMAMRRLARWDAATACRVDRYVANSRYVAGRIRRYYGRDAVVVYPPVDTAFYSPDGRTPEPYFLIVSALVPYKRIDIAIEAAHLAGVPLRIVGDGPDRGRLQSAAGPGVAFLGTRTNEEIRELYRGATAVILPGEEDFGIVAVEAQACGRPVVSRAIGGALETVIPGRTGVLVDTAGAEALVSGLREAAQRPFDPSAIRRHAERFSRERFGAEIRAAINGALSASGESRW